MPIRDLLYRCPRCGHDSMEAVDRPKRAARCPSCGTLFEQGRGAAILLRLPDGTREQSTASALMADIERLGGPASGAGLAEESLFREARITLGEAEDQDVIRFRGEVLGFSERVSWKGRGRLKLEGQELTFEPDEEPGPGPRQGFSCLLRDIRGVQISSKSLQVTLDGPCLYQFEFIDDSPKRWEDLLCLALSRFYSRDGRRIIEYKPRIITEYDPSAR